MVRLLFHLQEFEPVVALGRSLHVEVEVAQFLSDFLHLGVVVVLKNLAVDIIELMLAHARPSSKKIDLLAREEPSNVGLYLDEESDLFQGEVVYLSRKVALWHFNTTIRFLV